MVGCKVNGGLTHFEFYRVSIVGKITLKEIADILGVSIGTVDRAIHNRPEISSRTREAVLKAVELYGYKPDKVARSLSLKSKRKKIGVISKEKPDFFWNMINAGIKTAQKELTDYGIEVIFRTYREEGQIETITRNMEEFIENNVDAIAVVPKNIACIRDKINEAVGNGIVVSTFNDDLNNSKRAFYVGPQARQSGRIAGELMGRFLKNSGRVLILNIDIGSWEYFERLEGFKEILREKFSGINILADINFEYNENGINETNIKYILENLGDIDGIYDVDGASLYNVAHIKDSIGQLKNSILIGHEIWSRVSDYIADGTISACISQDPFTQGYYIMKLLFNCLTEGSMPRFEKMYTRLDVIMKENLVNKDNIINPFFSELY